MYKYLLYFLLIIVIVFQIIKYEKWLFKSKRRELMAQNNSTIFAFFETAVIFFEVLIFGSIIYSM